MTKPDSEYIIVGRIGSSYGVRGWVKIQTFTEFKANVLDYNPWYINEPDQPEKPLFVEEGKTHGNGIIAKIKGFESPEAIRVYAGKTIYIKRSQLPELKTHEYYWSDLEGLTVINHDGAILGKIIYLIETGANDVIVVKGTHDIAIPYLPGSVVLGIDMEKREMYVNWDPL